MIPDEKVRIILERLRDRSRRDEVRWARTQLLGYPSIPAFSIRFPGSRFTIAFFSPTADPDYYRLVFSDAEDRTVDTFIAREGEALFEVAAETFVEAHRSISGWDKVLADVERGVNSPEMVGLPVGTSAPDEDIPF